jgi:MFS family permease
MASRWTALALIFVSFLQFTLNWFSIIPAFGPLTEAMHVGLPQIWLIVGIFIGGYGLAHIPAGLIAEAWGMKNTMLLGIALEATGSALTAVAPDFTFLLVARFICGVGGSIYIGSAIGLTAGWFRKHELVTANGLITGVAFTFGATIGLLVWGPLIVALG